MTREELWGTLAAAGVANGPAPAASPPASPWYVQAMVAVAAWVASIFLLVFLGMLLSGLLRGTIGAVVVGAVLCALCALTIFMVRDNLFVEQVVAAASLAGQALMAYGILDRNWQSPAHWLAVAAIETIVLLAIPVYVHRVVAALAAAYALRFALVNGGAGVLFPFAIAASFVLAWRMSRTRAEADALWGPVIAGLALAALLVVPAVMLDTFVWRARHHGAAGVAVSWFATFALAGVLLAAVACILRDAGAASRSRVAALAFAGSAAVALAARPVPGLVVALVVLLVAFHEGRRALMGLAIAGLGGALVHHYYALDATLLEKSAALFATGLVLIVAGIALRMGLARAEHRHA